MMFFDQEKKLADLALGKHCILSNTNVVNINKQVSSNLNDFFVSFKINVLGRSRVYIVNVTAHKSIMTIMIIVKCAI